MKSTCHVCNGTGKSTVLKQEGRSCFACMGSGQKEIPLHEQISLLTQKLQIAMAALKFYADRENWVFSYHIHKGRNYREITNFDTYGIPHPENEHGQYFGGKTARKAIQLIEGINNDEAQKGH